MKINRRGAIQNFESVIVVKKGGNTKIGPLLGRFSFFLKGMVIIQTKYLFSFICFRHMWRV